MNSNVDGVEVAQLEPISTAESVAAELGESPRTTERNGQRAEQTGQVGTAAKSPTNLASHGRRRFA